MQSQAVAIRTLMILGGVSLVFLAGCGGGKALTASGVVSPSSPLPSPTITTISPSRVLAGGVEFILTVTGTNFIPSSVVNFGGTAVATDFLGGTKLSAVIPAAAIATVGTTTVVVSNPTAGGGPSNAMNFSIDSAATAVPIVSFLYPSCTPVGGKAFTLQVDGSSLVAGSVVRWNGSDLPTTISDTSGGGVTAQIPASDIAAPGTAAVTVFNPANGVSSNSLTFTITPGGEFPQSIAVDPTGKFAYVADAGCNGGSSSTVSMYTIDSTTGTLASIGPPVSSPDVCTDSVTVDPFGKFAYAANSGNPWDYGTPNGSISMYTINPTTGALTFTGLNPGDCCFNSVTVDPTGKFAYAATTSGILMYTINGTTGALTSIGTIATFFPISVAVDPTGKFAYAAGVGSGNSGEVSMYAIDTTTGVLTSIATVAAGLSATSIVIHPSGKFAYVVNGGSNDVSMYTIDPTTRILTSMGPIAAGTGPASVAADPAGNFAYVVNRLSNDVSMYAINATTGVLTTIGTIAAGSSPTSIAIHPSGKFAYVTNSGSNSVSMYSIDDGTGALTLIGTIGT